MELMDLVLLGLVSCVVSAITGTIIAFVAHNLRNREVERLERKIESEYMNALGAKGREKRNEKQERFGMAMSEAMVLLQSGKTPQDIIKELGVKYPDVALELVQKQLRL